MEAEAVPLEERSKVPEEPEAVEPGPTPALVRVRHDGDIPVVALDSDASFEALRDEIRRLFHHRRVAPPSSSEEGAAAQAEDADPVGVSEDVLVQDGGPEAAPAEAAPDEAAPAEDAPDETASAEAAPADGVLAEEAPDEAASAEDAPDETASAEVAPADGVLAEEAPDEEAPDEAASAEEPPAEEPPIDDTLNGLPGLQTRPTLAVRLDTGARPVDPFDLHRLVHLLKDDYRVAVTGVYCSPSAVHRYAQQQLKVPVLLREPLGDDDEPSEDCEGPIAAEPEPILRPKPKVERADRREAVGRDASGGRKLLVVDKTMRGGAVVRYAGDVIVFGDVNAGAQIEAGGNIYVLGSLRGLAHAGAPHTEGVIILAFDLRPTQLRIGGRIGYAPQREVKEQRGGGIGALFGFTRDQPEPQRTEIAYVRDGEITLEEYRGQLPVFADLGV